MIALPLRTKHGVEILVSIYIHCACQAMCNPKWQNRLGLLPMTGSTWHFLQKRGLTDLLAG